MCKMGTTRTAGFELLFTLVQDSKPAYNELLALLTVQHSKNEVDAPPRLRQLNRGFVEEMRSRSEIGRGADGTE